MFRSLIVAGLCIAGNAFAPPSKVLPFKHASRLDATTASGIEYNDVIKGDGRSPVAGDFVSVVYRTKYNGKYIDADASGGSVTIADGKLAESFKNRGLPWAQFAVGKGKVIPGWDETVQTMAVGGKRTLQVPAAMAYGDAGSPDGVIPPGADVEFEIELVSIDSSFDAIKGSALALQLVAGAILINGVTLALTGNELRAYLVGQATFGG